MIAGGVCAHAKRPGNITVAAPTGQQAYHVDFAGREPPALSQVAVAERGPCDPRERYVHDRVWWYDVPRIGGKKLEAVIDGDERFGLLAVTMLRWSAARCGDTEQK